MNNSQSYVRRIGKAFAFQALLISVAAILSLSVTTLLIKDILVQRALDLEAEHFWTNYGSDNAFPLPSTYNLRGYLDNRSSDIPVSIQLLDTGIHEFRDDEQITMLHISEQSGKRLFLLYNNAQVNRLIMLYALVPLGAVLILIYLTTWLAWRVSNQAFSPITWLAKKVDQLKPEDTDANQFKLEDLPLDANYEVQSLTAAMHRFALRLGDFVQRERDFTRDASHELRTPLTVIRIVADVLLMEDGLSSSAKESVKRIKRVCDDMQEITDAFLMLARESEIGDTTEEICVNTILKEEIEQARFLLIDKPVNIELVENDTLMLIASPKVVGVLIGNLLRNAVNYTDDGTVTARIDSEGVSIHDNGPGITDQELEQVFKPFFRGAGRGKSGCGVGLAIVKRILQRFNWSIRIDNKVEHGTKVSVLFHV